jgi:NADH-quinone oxidoreductase subunit C
MTDDPTKPPDAPASSPSADAPPPAAAKEGTGADAPPAVADAGAPAATPGATTSLGTVPPTAAPPGGSAPPAEAVAKTVPANPPVVAKPAVDPATASGRDAGPAVPVAKVAPAKPPAKPASGADAGTAKPPAKPAPGAEAGAAKPPAKAAVEHAPKAAPPVGPPDPPPPADKIAPAFIATLQTAVPDAVTALSYWVGDWTIIVAVTKILEVAAHLRQAPDAAFDVCSDVTATDWPIRPERFDVVYCLYSTRHRHRVRVKTKVAESQPFPSITPVWPAANWLERELWDMFGINFTDHPDRRRILMPEDWQGFPQRKDYPLEGPGELLMENPLDWLKLRQSREEADIE